MIKFTCSLIMLVCYSCIATAQLRLPAMVSDSMILQRDKPVNIWGWWNGAGPVTVNFNGKEFKAKADEQQRWQLQLPATPAGGPYTLTIQAGKETKTIREILMGDVWLCSGQSNMEFIMGKLTEKYPDEIAASNNPMIREFQVTLQYAMHPNQELNGKWRVANPANIGSFSAVAYFMVKALYEKYKVPMAVIKSTWGGTPAESWISEEGLHDFSGYLDRYHFYQDSVNMNNAINRERTVTNLWQKDAKEGDKGRLPENNWKQNDFPANNIGSMQVPGFWEKYGLKDVDGVIWCKKKFAITAQQASTEAWLELGMIDDADSTYINGILVGFSTNRYVARKYKVPAGILHEGNNTITVRIVDTDGNGGFIAEKNYRILWKDSALNLAGTWEYAVGNVTAALPVASFIKMSTQPITLYNAMIHPLIPYTIKGAAWYQGESNGGRPGDYRRLLTALIKDWRGRWQQGDFPFLIVQLANYMEIVKEPGESGWANLREAQQQVTKDLPNVGLAVTIDIGETYDVHPLKKKEVGERLSLAARKLAYNDKKLVYSGPELVSYVKRGNAIELTFQQVGSGLVAMGDKPLEQFAIAGADHKFVWASAKIIGKNKVLVASNLVTEPEAVRYAWANNPKGCNLYNKEGLPASPFRTDDWVKKP
jgi:sialate O-acetylesterase